MVIDFTGITKEPKILRNISKTSLSTPFPREIDLQIQISP